MTYIPWYGNNAKILPIIRDYFPDFYKINGYIEPLVGPGTVYFYLMENYIGALQGKPIYLSDINKELINCHRTVRDSPDKVELVFEKHIKLHSEKHYYEVRNKYPPGDGMADIEKAGAFIYLVGASYENGWRVNSHGKMNVSFNDNSDSKIYSRNFHDELNRCSRLLKFAHINTMSFEKVLGINSKKGGLKDFFVFLDYPYRKIEHQYDKNKWDLDSKLKLVSTFKTLDKMGAKVMLVIDDKSCHYIEYENFVITPIFSSSELVITNYKPIRKQKTIEESWSL